MVLAIIGIGLVEHGGKGLSPDMTAPAILAGFTALPLKLDWAPP